MENNVCLINRKAYVGIVLVVSMILGGLSVFCIIGNSQNPNSEFNKKRTRDKWEKF